jgi:type IV secretion system protein VirB1
VGRRDPVLSRAVDDATLPGVMVEVTPADARALGAFEETALSDDDAWEANADLDAGPAGAEARHGG